MIARDGDLTIRRMRDDTDEYARIAAWRNLPHVREWWDPDDPPMTVEAARTELRPDVVGDSESRACIIAIGDVPVGFIQYYPWAAYESDLIDAGITVPPGSWSLDIFIGDPAWVGRGVGSRAVRLLCDHMLSNEGATAVAFGVDTENLRARRAYEKAGMVATIEFLDTDTRGGQRTPSILLLRYAPHMGEQDVFVMADRALGAVVAQIRPDQWSMQLPPGFSRAATDHTPTLREVVNHHAYEDAWVPDMLAGRTMDEVGPEKFKGDLLGDDPAASFAALVESACTAALALDDLDRPVHTSFGDFPARAYLWQTNYFRGLRAHDIAGLIGVDANLSDALIQGLWDELRPQVEGWRKIGVVPPEVAVAEDAPLLDRLLGLAGRRPS